ncbi:hypothetical protein F5Y18DRAFT_382421 [Xylariaceae sp. FL1019]|nr:hypothetical protein F5Y18DRAFT_382421 [Xylariaceae sp. FL1019]
MHGAGARDEQLGYRDQQQSRHQHDGQPPTGPSFVPQTLQQLFGKGVQGWQPQVQQDEHQRQRHNSYQDKGRHQQRRRHQQYPGLDPQEQQPQPRYASLWDQTSQVEQDPISGEKLLSSTFDLVYQMMYDGSEKDDEGDTVMCDCWSPGDNECSRLPSLNPLLRPLMIDAMDALEEWEKMQDRRYAEHIDRYMERHPDSALQWVVGGPEESSGSDLSYDTVYTIH